MLLGIMQYSVLPPWGNTCTAMTPAWPGRAMHCILPDLQEDAEDLIDDRDVEIPDAAAAPLNYRRINREEEDNAREEDIIRRIEERYKDYQVGE